MAGLPNVDSLAAYVESAADAPTARLQRAVGVSRELAELGDELIERFVSEARAAGASWTEIGQAFGTSRQAAQKRYGTVQLDAGAWPGDWAPPARRALDIASEQASILGHDYIGTEHVLLGLVGVEEGMAAHVLQELGVTLDGLLGQAHPEPREPRPYDCLGVMPRLKRALELARRIAERQGHRQPNSEHLLAAIIQVPDALAISLLDRLGVSVSDVFTTLARRLDVDPESLRFTRRRRRRLRVASR